MKVEDICYSCEHFKTCDVRRDMGLPTDWWIADKKITTGLIECGFHAPEMKGDEAKP